jgi:O-antigen/teichoic acid export membrane protein
MRKFGLLSMTFTAFSMVLYRADIIFVRRLVGDSQAGLYAAAVQWSQFVWVLPIAVEGVMMQSTSRWWTEGKTNEITAMVSRLLRYTMLVTAFVLILVFEFADQILLVYFGPKFAEASLSLRILVPGVFSFSLARVVWPVIQARGSVVPLVAVVGSACMLNLGLILLLVPVWQAVGAAVATSVAFGGVVFAYAWILRKNRVQVFSLSLVGRLLILCTVTILVLMPVSTFIPSALGSVGIGFVLACCVYGAGALSLGLLSVSEIQKIVESLPGPLHGSGAWAYRKLQPTLSRIETRLTRKGRA